jgi:metal-responsive CopG/Arc/MetJ family transcriptional regulator
MRTTIRMDEELLERVKVAAARSGRTLTRFIEDAVRHQLALERENGAAEEPGLLVFSGTGVRPGVDLDSNADLLALMDGEA